MKTLSFKKKHTNAESVGSNIVGDFIEMKGWDVVSMQYVRTYYDDLSQRLSAGALIPAQAVLGFIPNGIPEIGNNSNLIDVSSLNVLLNELIQEVFDKYPR